MKSDAIRPEDMLHVLLPASSIPDQSMVSHKMGEYTHVLRTDLTLHTMSSLPVEVKGIFLIGTGGHIKQVSPDTKLLWHVSAETFVNTLQRSWDDHGDHT